MEDAEIARLDRTAFAVLFRCRIDIGAVEINDGNLNRVVELAVERAPHAFHGAENLVVVGVAAAILEEIARQAFRVRRREIAGVDFVARLDVANPCAEFEIVSRAIFAAELAREVFVAVILDIARRTARERDAVGVIVGDAAQKTEIVIAALCARAKFVSVVRAAHHRAAHLHRP